LYSNGTEKTLQDFFAHKEQHASREYWDFMNIIGEKINLKGWKKYRGDFSTDSEQEAYYTEWKNISVMFHVCLWMNAEQHRRLIGNDVVFIIYHDAQKPFDPVPLDSLGTVPQVFAVVQKFEDSYRLGFFSRPTIKPFMPRVPGRHSFVKEALKDFLFTKVYNGYCQALTCPPMNRLLEVPRANTITELVTKYPREKRTRKSERKKKYPHSLL